MDDATAKAHKPEMAAGPAGGADNQPRIKPVPMAAATCAVCVPTTGHFDQSIDRPLGIRRRKEVSCGLKEQSGKATLLTGFWVYFLW